MSWRQEIDLRCSFGVWPFKKSLEITPRGFDWCGEIIPLKSVTRIRWGVDLKRGGIFPRRTYIAAFGTDEKEYIIKTKQKDFYEHLTDRYWKAVGRRLLSEMLKGLAEGKNYRFGDLVVTDDGIITARKRALVSPKEEFYAWDRLLWGIVNGSICFALKEEPDRILAGCSFLWTDNAHILNVAMGLKQNSPEKKKLSSSAY